MKYNVLLDNLPFFGNEVLRTFYPNLKTPSLYQKVKRWLDCAEFIQLKKGLYMTATYWRTHEQDQNLHLFLANSLRYPSYVSGAYFLQRHDMLTEITHPITSVTLKSSRNYNNKIGAFVYSSISEDLYTGFVTEKYREETVYVASRAKALFDFFYFKYGKTKTFPPDIKERDRISMEKLTSREKKEFRTYCEKCHLRIFKKLPYLFFHE